MRTTAELGRAPRANWSPSQFVVVPENCSAVLAVRRLARRLDRCPFVPLVLYGRPGTGKSHLADDLLTWAAKRGDVLSLQAAEWSAADITEAERCDLLIIEDLQHLPERAADEFANLLDRRVDHRRATLLTGSKGPAELANLAPRLVSRLVGGLVIGLPPLSVGSRREFLAKRASARGLALEDGVLDWLAQHTPGSGRQLLAALEQARLLSMKLPAPLDAAMLAVHFGETFGKHRPTLKRITEDVGWQYQVAPRLIRGRSRQPGVLWPRQVAMYLARDLTDLSLVQIGEFFGRDHTTVRHACQRVCEVIATDADIAGRVYQLRSHLM